MTRKTVVTLVVLGCGLSGVILAHDWQTQVPAASTAGEVVLPARTDEVADANQEDDDAVRLIAEANQNEALAWLNDSKTARGVARWEKTEIIDLVKGFYTAGAPKVYVVDINRVAGTEVASQFIVQLPTDPRIRKQIFDCEGKFQAEYDEEATPDTGQKYLYLTTD